MRRRHGSAAAWPSVVLFVVVTLATSAAMACPVCGASKSDNDWAFGLTTLVLSVLPPAIMGGVVWFLVRAHRRAAREQTAVDGTTVDTGALPEA